jgi:hypothetical protein
MQQIGDLQAKVQHLSQAAKEPTPRVASAAPKAPPTSWVTLDVSDPSSDDGDPPSPPHSTDPKHQAAARSSLSTATHATLLADDIQPHHQIATDDNDDLAFIVQSLAPLPAGIPSQSPATNRSRMPNHRFVGSSRATQQQQQQHRASSSSTSQKTTPKKRKLGVLELQ